MTNDRPKSIALVGCGAWGRNIARVLSQLRALRTICDSNAAMIEPLAAELGVGFTTDLNAVLSSQEVEAIAIATPASTHAEIVRQALVSGKHAFVEKPIALVSSDAEALSTLANAQKRVLMIGHLLQYHPGFLKLLEIVRQGTLGKITYVYSNRLNQGRIRTEENALWSLSPHDFSMVLAVVGASPLAVTASGAAIVQPGIPDLATVNLAFPGGIKGHIFCSWLNAFKEHKLTVIGDQAMAIFDDTPQDWANKSVKLCAHKVVKRNGIPEFIKGAEEIVPFEKSEPLKNELAHFLACIASGSVPRTGPNEAIPVLKALEAAQIAMEKSIT